MLIVSKLPAFHDLLKVGGGFCQSFPVAFHIPACYEFSSKKTKPSPAERRFPQTAGAVCEKGEKQCRV